MRRLPVHAVRFQLAVVLGTRLQVVQALLETLEVLHQFKQLQAELRVFADAGPVRLAPGLGPHQTSVFGFARMQSFPGKKPPRGIGDVRLVHATSATGVSLGAAARSSSSSFSASRRLARSCSLTPLPHARCSRRCCASPSRFTYKRMPASMHPRHPYRCDSMRTLFLPFRVRADTFAQRCLCTSWTTSLQTWIR